MTKFKKIRTAKCVDCLDSEGNSVEPLVSHFIIGKQYPIVNNMVKTEKGVSCGITRYKRVSFGEKELRRVFVFKILNKKV